MGSARLKIPRAAHRVGHDLQNPEGGVVLMNSFSEGFAGSGRKTALMSPVAAVAVSGPANIKESNDTEATLRPATNK